MAHKLKSHERSEFTDTLSILLGASMPLDMALDILAGLLENKRLQSFCRALAQRVREGESLSSALGDYGAGFSEAYKAMVRVGETGGALASVLEKLAQNLRRNSEIKRRIVSALFYPTILMFFSTAALLFIMIYVLPSFVQVFKDMRIELPPMAGALVWTGEMLDAYGLSLALGVCILLLLIVWGWRLPSTNLVLSRMLLRLGPVGRILSWWETVLFYRSLGLMLEFGVPMHEACRLAPTAVNNTGFQKALSRLAQTVAQGSSMVAALSECKVIPKVALRMVALGEQTGSLSGVLLKTADLLESRLNFVVGRILLITEPLITLFMGLLVGLVVITMLTTIFSLTQGGI